MVLSVDAQLVPRKGTCSVEGRTPCNLLISGALTLGVSRGSRLDVPSLFPVPWRARGRSVGRLQKERWDISLFPITPPVTRVLGGEASGALNALALVRASGALTVSLRSTPLGSLETASVFDGCCRSTPDRFARRYFRLRGFDRRWRRIRKIRASN